jgi:hypothetical protein
LGLTIHGKRGDGCFYFLDFEGNQVGETVYVCYLKQLSLRRWVNAAEFAKNEKSEKGVYSIKILI